MSTAPQNRRFAPKIGASAPILGAEERGESLTTALFGSTRRAVLALLFGHPDETFYMRQIARIVNAGQGAIQRELRQLTESGILIRSVKGRADSEPHGKCITIAPSRAWPSRSAPNLN